MQSRRDEILAKKARLAELKQQRVLRAAQAGSRQSIGASLDVWQLRYLVWVCNQESFYTDIFDLVCF